MIKAIFINGSAESGKGRFVEYVKELAEEHGIVVLNPSTINSVKSACAVLGVPIEPKTDAKRKLWNKVKAAYIEYNDGPFHEAVKYIDSLNKSAHHIVFVDVREPKELAKFKNHYQDECITLLIKREKLKHVPDNEADRNVDNFSYDHTIRNFGSLDVFREGARVFFKYLMERRNAIAA